MRLALQMTGELIAEAWDDYMFLVQEKPYEAGKIFGRSMFEVAALVAPWAKAGQLSNISKLRFLESLQAEVAAGRVAIFRSFRVQQKLGRLILYTKQLIRLCFPGHAGSDTPTVRSPSNASRPETGSSLETPSPDIRRPAPSWTRCRPRRRASSTCVTGSPSRSSPLRRAGPAPSPTVPRRRRLSG